MEVYRLKRRKAPTLFMPKDRSALKEQYGADFYFSDGHPLAEGWQPITMGISGKKPKKSWPAAPGDGRLLVLSEAGLGEYGDFLRPHGEFLPAHYKDSLVWLFHCTNMLDPFNHDNCVYDGSYFDGFFMVMRYVEFDESKLANDTMFGLKRYDRWSLYYATDSGVPERLDALCSSMEGVCLQKVWPVA